MQNRDKNSAFTISTSALTSTQFNEIASIVATIGEPDVLVERILRFVRRQLAADVGSRNRTPHTRAAPEGRTDKDSAALIRIGAPGRSLDYLALRGRQPQVAHPPRRTPWNTAKPMASTVTASAASAPIRWSTFSGFIGSNQRPTA